MDSGIGSSLDRISMLPDSILCHILSFLPTKYAVRTSILSTRWQYLWASVTSLDLDDCVRIPEPDELGYQRGVEDNLRFTNFVNRVLLLSDVSCFEKIDFTLWSIYNFDLVNTWISAAIKRNVQKFRLSYSLGEMHYLDDPVQLPRVIFTSKTLVDLKLYGAIFLKIPNSVCLPSLKSLHLNEVVYGVEDSLQKLLSGCPVLEELSIYRCLSDTQQELNISVPSLKCLMITRYSIYDANDQHYKLVVNAPKLEHLHLSDDVAQEFSMENLSCLSKAYVDSRSLGSTDHNGCISKLLKGIANVTSLHFITEGTDYLLPTFRNLTCLRPGGGSMSCWNLDFRQYSPNLEVLIVEGNGVLDSAKLWSPPPNLPPCLLLHLKEIEILKVGGKECELEVIAYLLENAKVLKKMTINCQHLDSIFCGKLAGLPTGSETCQLNLLH